MTAPLLPLAYFVLAAGAFIAATAAVPWLADDFAGHYYRPRVVALTHTVALGWITVTIMGASYQLIPIILGRSIWSERLARWQLVVLATGIVGMVAHFYLAQWSGLLWAAGLVVIAVGIHLVNVARSGRGLAWSTFTARLMTLALGGLALTVVFGVVLGADRIWKFLPTPFFPTLSAHFHLALLGWITPVVLGVAARVYPTFLLAPETGGWPARLQLWGLGLGAPLVVGGLLFSAALVLPGALAVGAAMAGHAWSVVRAIRSRKRPALDWPLRFTLTGTAFLAGAGTAGLGLAAGLLSGPRAALAYAILALGGWVSLTIVGVMLKIVPLLVWYRAYGATVGRAPVPTLAQLSWTKAERVAYALLTGGIVFLTVAVALGDARLVRAAGTVLAAGGGAFAAALAHILRHLGRRSRGAWISVLRGRL